MAAKVEPDEKAKARVLRAVVTAMDQDDYAWVYARYALDVGEVSREDRRVLKALREAGHLVVGRGGVNEDSEISGGSGYAPTNAGRAWLAEIEKQQEMPL